MKAILSFVLLSCLGIIHLFAQDCEIHLMAVALSEKGGAPAAANKYLVNKLCSAVTSDGISASGDYAQFFVAAKALPIYEEVVPGAPVRTALTLSLNLYIGDDWGEKIFSHTSMEIRGVGESRERAYLNAFRSLNKNNAEIVAFLSEGKKHILDYYNTEYGNILKEAERAVQLRNHERALFLLTAVPTCCEGYNMVSDKLEEVYRKYINYNCDRLLMEARTAWAAHPDKYGAKQVGEILNQLEPDASCYDEAMSLYKEVKAKVKDDWDFQMRQKYNDQIEIRKQIIEAARAVGTAYGKGQQPKTTNILWMK